MTTHDMATPLIIFKVSRTSLEQNLTLESGGI
jgi:hypothetical protein